MRKREQAREGLQVQVQVPPRGEEPNARAQRSGAAAHISAPLALCCALLTACTTSNSPIGPLAESRLLRSQMSDAEFGGLRIQSGTGFHFQLYEGDLPAGPVRVPMNKRFRGLPGIEVRLNERHTVNMLADTGAQLCILDARAVLSARGRVYIPSKTGFTVTGIGGNETAWLARFDSAEIGPLRLRAFTTLVRRHKTISQFSGLPVADIPINLLGCPVFLGFNHVTFDYPRGEFIFSSASSFTPPRAAIAIPMSVREQLIYVPLRIGKNRIEAVLDTGAKDQIFLSSATVRRFDLAERAAAGGTYRAIGLGGETEGRQFSVPLAFLGDLPLRNVVVDTAESDAWPARIGTELLGRWRVTLDFQRGTLWLE